MLTHTLPAKEANILKDASKRKHTDRTHESLFSTLMADVGALQRRTRRKHFECDAMREDCKFRTVLIATGSGSPVFSRWTRGGCHRSKQFVVSYVDTLRSQCQCALRKTLGPRCRHHENAQIREVLEVSLHLLK